MGTHIGCTSNSFLNETHRDHSTGCDQCSLTWRLNTPSHEGKNHLPWTVVFKIYFITGNLSNKRSTKFVHHWYIWYIMMSLHTCLSCSIHIWYQPSIPPKKHFWKLLPHRDLLKEWSITLDQCWKGLGSKAEGSTVPKPSLNKQFAPIKKLGSKRKVPTIHFQVRLLLAFRGV